MLIENKIKLLDLSINYVEGGTGDPIIFLHNGGGFWHSWEHQLNYYSHTHHVFGIDWPGFGESELPDGLISLQLLSNILESFIDNKGLKNVILVGNCIGGSAALLYNMRRPEMVKDLIIFNICPGSLIYPVRSVRKLISSSNKYPYLKKLLSRLFVFSFTKTPVKKQFPKILFGKSISQNTPLHNRYLNKFKENKQTRSRVNLVFSVHTFDLIKFLNPDSIPKHLLIWGRENRVTSLKKHGYYHLELLKSEEFVIIENAGHLCMYESPEIVNDTISKYINKQS